MITLEYRAGTLELKGLQPDCSPPSDALRWDARSSCFRAPARAYADIVRRCRATQTTLDDRARSYIALEQGPCIMVEPRPYQCEAIDAWAAAQCQGVVVLPTGAGKTLVALMAIAKRPRATLVVSPTLELVRQWYDVLRRSFRTAVGVIGGGEFDIKPLTVTTYDSAHRHMDHLGNRFGLIVFDECHHLPSPGYALAAECALAPLRLGLTATPERADGAEERLAELIGPIVYRKEIVELAGDYLAPYRTERIIVELSPEERAEYECERAVYLDFVRAQGIRLGDSSAWARFIAATYRSNEGKRAMAAYRCQRRLALRAPAKLDALEGLLAEHRADRTLIFTDDNATAYEISRRFLVPIITHQTKVKERSQILERFANGDYRAIVTSKVLNEGVDVPDANVAVVISGTGSVREHVQRLGRILRRSKTGDKRAVLYELVTARTGETFTSERRREHVAYQRTG